MRCVALIVLAACANIGERPRFDAGPIAVGEDSGVVQLTGPGFRLDFASAGIRLPQRLLINGIDRLAGNGCALEGQIGIAVFPAVVAIAGERGVATRSQLVVEADGPAVAKIRVDYEVDYSCGGIETAAGQTTFTAFPSGRIVREDVDVRPSTATLTRRNQCGCQDSTTPAPLFFTSFYAFQRGRDVDPAGNPTTGGSAAACTMYNDAAIGVAWSGTSTRVGVNGVSSHVFDWAAGAQTLSTTPQAVTSAIQIGTAPPEADSDCGAVLAGLADVPIAIDGRRMETTDHDGIYRDPVRHDDAFDIVAPSVPIPPGFAVSLDLGGADHAAVTRDPAPANLDDVFLVQREDGDRFLFVFSDGLAAGQTITIEPKL